MIVVTHTIASHQNDIRHQQVVAILNSMLTPALSEPDYRLSYDTTITIKWAYLKTSYKTASWREIPPSLLPIERAIPRNFAAKSLSVTIGSLFVGGAVTWVDDSFNKRMERVARKMRGTPTGIVLANAAFSSGVGVFLNQRIFLHSLLYVCSGWGAIAWLSGLNVFGMITANHLRKKPKHEGVAFGLAYSTWVSLFYVLLGTEMSLISAYCFLLPKTLGIIYEMDKDPDPGTVIEYVDEDPYAEYDPSADSQRYERY